MCMYTGSRAGGGHFRRRATENAHIKTKIAQTQVAQNQGGDCGAGFSGVQKVCNFVHHIAALPTQQPWGGITFSAMGCLPIVGALSPGLWFWWHACSPCSCVLHSFLNFWLLCRLHKYGK